MFVDLGSNSHSLERVPGPSDEGVEDNAAKRVSEVATIMVPGVDPVLDELYASISQLEGNPHTYTNDDTRAEGENEESQITSDSIEDETDALKSAVKEIENQTSMTQYTHFNKMFRESLLVLIGAVALTVLFGECANFQFSWDNPHDYFGVVTAVTAVGALGLAAVYGFRARMLHKQLQQELDKSNETKENKTANVRLQASLLTVLFFVTLTVLLGELGGGFRNFSPSWNGCAIAGTATGGVAALFTLLSAKYARDVYRAPTLQTKTKAPLLFM